MDKRSKSSSNRDEEIAMVSAGGGNAQMTTRKSQLELRNDLVNSEMKHLFKQVNGGANDGDATVINANDTNNNTITLNVVHGAAPLSTQSKSNLTYADVNPVKASSQSQYVKSGQNFDKVNFNNAVLNKNFGPMQQQQHNETTDTSDVTLFSNNISTSDVYLNDDLSLLPTIDDKTLLSSLKAKFEMRKYFVSALLEFELFEFFLPFSFKLYI